MVKDTLKKLFANTYLYIVLAFLYLPIILIIVYSFSGSARFSFANGFNFNSYREILGSAYSESLIAALKNTFLIAIVSSVVSTVLGTVSSIGIFSMKKRVRTVVEDVNQLPIINSEIVMAVSLMIFFVSLGMKAGLARLIIGHISFCTPYVVLSVIPKLEQLDPNVYEAALDLGASPNKALIKVLIPNLVPGIVSGFVMAFTLSMDDFIVSQLNKGTVQTLSTLIYEDASKRGLEPFWFAVFSIFFVVVLTTVLLINLYNIRHDKRKAKEKETK